MQILVVDHAHIHCVQSFFALLCLKFHAVIFLHLVAQTAYMHKCFFIGIVMLDETKPFGVIEKFNGTGDLLVLHGNKF